MCSSDLHGDHFLLSFRKDVSFLGKVSLTHHLRQIPDNATVIIDACRADFIDQDVREVIGKFVEDAPERGIHVECRQLERTARESPTWRDRMTVMKRFATK